MFGGIFDRWLWGRRPSAPGPPSGDVRPENPGKEEEAQLRPRALHPPPPGPQEAPGPPPTIQPGWTLREYLSQEIRDRIRWLEGRYGGKSDAGDHGRLLDALQKSEAAAIRRPPLAARRLLQENRRTDTSLKKLEEIIETDPALLQSLLKHANSVFYATGSGGSPVVAVPPALRRLGSKGIEIVVMSHMVEGALCRPGEGLDDLAAAIWAHMVRTAPLARTLAPGFGVDPDLAYALGLLHDVGKLVLFNRVADLRKSLRRPVRLDPGFIPAALRKLHEPLGSLAVLEWGLGDEAALAVALHHRTPVPEPPSPASEVIFLAEKMDLIIQKGDEPNLSALWAQGELSGSLEGVTSLWEESAPPSTEEGDSVEESSSPPAEEEDSVEASAA